jgi:pimeloyl-ACP methyl ester carboxylesterase
VSRSANLVLVHGAWHGSWAFEPLAERLAGDGWTVRTVDLPSAGSANSDLHDDADAVRAVLGELSGASVVVGHSYGGYVTAEAAAGRADVVGTVYLCAGIPEVGEPVWTDTSDPNQVAAWITIDEAAGITTAGEPERVFYADCDPAVAAASVQRLRPQSLSSFMTPANGAAWQEKPSAYLICDEDQCLVSDVQAALAVRAGHVEHLGASHSPFLSHPAAVAKFLESALATF